MTLGRVVRREQHSSRVALPGHDPQGSLVEMLKDERNTAERGKGERLRALVAAAERPDVAGHQMRGLAGTADNLVLEVRRSASRFLAGRITHGLSLGSVRAARREADRASGSLRRSGFSEQVLLL